VNEFPTTGDAVSLDDLLDSLAARFQAGEAVDVEELARQYPPHASELRRLLPAMAALNRGPGSEPLGELGDFRLLREAGRGGMGLVYEADQISLGRRVALKILPFAAALDPRQLQRFRNESQIAAQLHHPNIVPIHAVGVDRGVHYYAMQFIDGRPLSALIAQMRRSDDPARTIVYANEANAMPVPPAATTAPAARATERSTRGKEFSRSAARLGIQAAEALEFAHQAGVLHRDIKPANLMLDGRGNLWVTDFGLAQVRSDVRLTATGDLVGTLRYMSPEQALATRVPLDQRSDIYSLGVTLYEVLALEPAFNGNDRQELLRQVAFEEPRPLRSHDRGIPVELETVIMKAMSKNPADRYTTAQELADDLRRWLDDQPSALRRTSPC
jgi:serine/threonine protein kinase